MRTLLLSAGSLIGVAALLLAAAAKLVEVALRSPLVVYLDRRTQEPIGNELGFMLSYNAGRANVRA